MCLDVLMCLCKTYYNFLELVIKAEICMEMLSSSLGSIGTFFVISLFHVLNILCVFLLILSAPYKGHMHAGHEKEELTGLGDFEMLFQQQNCKHYWFNHY